MLAELAKAADGALKGAVISAGSNYVQAKATEIVKTKFFDPHLISKINDKLRAKYGSQTFYNDLDAYITEDNTIDSVFDMFYNIGNTTVLSSREFVIQKLDAFSDQYPQYGRYDIASIKECFETIYEAVYESCVRLNPHTEFGKLQLSQAIYADQGRSEHEELSGKMDLILSKVNSIMLNSNSLPTVAADVESASEAIKAYLKEIDSVGSESCPVKGDNDAIEKYQKLLADVPIVLRGESQKQLDQVICSIESHLAIQYSNLGRVKEAFECLCAVPQEVAETSKLYQFVYAMIIVGHHITDKYSDAECSINRALELDKEYHRAFLVRQLLLAMNKSADKVCILSEMDSRFYSIVAENNNADLIADYYAFRGFVCKEYEDYVSAEQDYIRAKEFGYDKSIADLNIGLLYYSRATSNFPRNERLFCFDIDVSLIYQVIDLYRKYLFGEDEVSQFVKTHMIDVYVSCCSLIGAKHGLTPISEYVRLPNLEYETKRTLLLGYSGTIDDDLLSILLPEDQLYVKIANSINNNTYECGKRVFSELTLEEISSLPISTIYLILQASVLNKDLDSYKMFRCYIHDGQENAIVDCMDAYALEAEGDIQAAIKKVESYSTTSVDYKLLRNILGIYLRNNYHDEARKIFFRILELSNESKLHIDDKFDFLELATRYFTKQNSMDAKRFIDAVELDNSDAWRLKADFYYRLNDVQNLLIALNWLCENSYQYKFGFNKVICLVKLMRYDEALSAAESLLGTIHENNIKDKTDVMWLISNIYLFMDNDEQSYEWAKRAHELTLHIPNDKSHQAFFSRSMRTGKMDESFEEILKYRRLHPVVISDWMKEIQVSEDASGDEFISALNEATGHSHEEYEGNEKYFVSLYKFNPFVPNSAVLKHYGNDYSRFFGFAAEHKLRVSNGSWSDKQAKERLIKDHVCIDSLTLVLLQHYGCLDAIKDISHVHICYSTLEVIQNRYQMLSAAGEVREILSWIKTATNVVLEPDGYLLGSSLSNLFDDEYIASCRVAASNNIPLLTIEPHIEDFSKIEEERSFENLQAVGVVSLCFATMSSTPDKLSEALYNLMGDCTFINFQAETIIERIKSNNCVVEESLISRFFNCNTNYDMISFERVYISTIKVLLTERQEAAIDFAKIVLENSITIWGRGGYYRYLTEYFEDEKARAKSIAILRYLVLLIYDIEKIFADGIPEKIQGPYSSIKKSIYKHFGDGIIQKMLRSLELNDN